MNDAAIQRGIAPPTARSLTVPWIESEPMSPPGKKIGRTTNESVVSAMRPAATGSAGLILQAIEDLVTEGGPEDGFEQRVRQRAAAAVAEHDAVVVAGRARAATAAPQLDAHPRTASRQRRARP